MVAICSLPTIFALNNLSGDICPISSLSELMGIFTDVCEYSPPCQLGVAMAEQTPAHYTLGLSSRAACWSWCWEAEHL